MRGAPAVSATVLEGNHRNEGCYAEVINVVQTIVVILLILAGGVLVQANMSALQAPITLAMPNSASIAVTAVEIFVAALAALVVVWFAGQLDRAILMWQLRRRETVREEERGEILRTQPAAADREPTVMYVSLTNIHKRLDAIEQQLDTLRQRVDRALGTRVSARGGGQ